MRSVIDADSLCYIIGFGHEGMPLNYQLKMLDEFIENILVATEATEFMLYLTGSGNFRYDVATFQPYKGNRADMKRPEYLKEMRDYMEGVWGAEVINGMEADDQCGIDAYACKAEGKPYTICSIDKDLLMLEGKHYNYKRGEFETITETEGWRRFYMQTLTGDTSDNIPGLYKITGAKATKAIKEPLLSIEVREEMDAYCLGQYVSAGSSELDTSARTQYYREIQELLYMRRKPLGEEDYIEQLRKATS